jgi:hypothetical protein
MKYKLKRDNGFDLFYLTIEEAMSASVTFGFLPSNIVPYDNGSSGSIVTQDLSLPSSSYAMTASYMDSNMDTTISSISTGSQTLLTANTWQEVKYNLTTTTSSLWNHDVDTGVYTCLSSGEYLLQLRTYMQKSSGGNILAGIHILKDGVEMVGSYSVTTITSNNVGQHFSVTLSEKIQSG